VERGLRLSCVQVQENSVFDPSRCTSINKHVLTRLIAAARVTETVAWDTAETEAVHQVTALWGGLASARQALPVEVNTDVLLQLAAAAHAAINAPSASGSEWAVQVVRDVAEARRLTTSAFG
jgi:hypothetical protein